MDEKRLTEFEAALQSVLPWAATYKHLGGLMQVVELGRGGVGCQDTEGDD